MQFAEIAVNTKTSLNRQTFTYSIPPQLLPDIKQGILVLVPFHGRRLHGVILSFKHLNTGTFKHKLKPIIKIIDTYPVLDNVRIELAKWMSDYYLTPIGEIIFSMIPPIAMRSINKNSISQFKAIALNCDKLYTHPGKTYTLYDRTEIRINNYLKLIEKSIAKNRSCLVLFHNIIQAQEFHEKLDREIRSVLFHSEMTKTQRYLIWNDIRVGKYQVVIGTRPTVFAPVDDLGLIIIDQPENFGYKENQGSKYHSLEVAKKLIQFTNANLILGSLVPSVETYYFEQLKKYQKLQNKSIDSETKITKRIIDLNNQKNKIISWELEDSIRKILEKSQKILLFTQKKGEGSSLICQDCGYIFKCEQCGLPYSQIADCRSQIANLTCQRCNIKKLIPQSCSKCHGIRLKTFGIGLETVRREVSKLFPNISIGLMDQDTLNIRSVINENQIIVATKKIIDYPNPKFDLVCVIGLDNLLNLPDYKSTENIYFTIVNLLYMSKDQFLLQTYSPENRIWNFINQSCPFIFLQKELITRKNNNFPPYNQLIKFIYQNEDDNKCIVESQKLSSQLLPRVKAGSTLNSHILGPSPSFINKTRGKYQYQILIFINNIKQKHQLHEIISKLPKGWKIDVDPISLI